MRSFLLYFIIFSILTAGTAKSQSSSETGSEKLQVLFDRLINNYNDTDRIRINDSIILVLDGYVKSENIFSDRLTNLRYLGQITSPDSVVKIISWNLVLENEPGRYFCYFIRKQLNDNENQIYKLMAKYDARPVETDTTYTRYNWYGALYYDLRPYEATNGRSWILLGIDFGNPDISRKIIDVLNFNQDGSIIFGKKSFVSGDSIHYRTVFGYASNAMMSLRFKSDTAIVFDHLVPFSPGHSNDRQYYGPDYSFDSYSFENGLWKLRFNVDARNK